MSQIVNVLREVNGFTLKDAKGDPNIDTTLDPIKTITQIKEKNELPTAYLLFLEDIQKIKSDRNKINLIFLKILRLYVYARSQNRNNPRALKTWLKSGRLPAEDFAGRIGMGLLYKKLEIFSKKSQKFLELEDEINKNENATVKLKGKAFEKFKAKEELQDDIKEEMLSSLDEIVSILDKIETLIAPRSDK